MGCFVDLRILLQEFANSREPGLVPQQVDLGNNPDTTCVTGFYDFLDIGFGKRIFILKLRMGFVLVVALGVGAQ